MDLENSSCGQKMDMENSSCCEKMDTMDIDAGKSIDQGQGSSSQTDNPNYVNVAPAPAPVPKPSRCLLPPMEEANKKTLVLDLDKTLIHSRQNSGLGHDFTLTFPNIVAQIYTSKKLGAVATCCGSPTFYVWKRPGVEDMLQQLGGLYEIIVFTSSGK